MAARRSRAISRADNTTSADATSVKQYLGDWSDHVTGWTATSDFPVHVMRYEDMKADPQAAFTKLLGFLGIPFLSVDGWWWLAPKVFFFASCFIWFRASFPRYRYDQIMRLGWKVFIPVTIAWICVTALLVHFNVFTPGQ